MYTSRNNILKSFLGTVNCGQIKLSESQQFEIYRQTLEYLLEKKYGNSPKIPRSIYDNYKSVMYTQLIQTPQFEKYMSDDSIKNLARAENITLSAAARKVGNEEFKLKLEDLFGYEYSQSVTSVGYRQKTYFRGRDSMQDLEVPKQFIIDDQQFNFAFLLQYSDTDGDFMAGEAFYKNNDDTLYFPINVCYKPLFTFGDWSPKELVPGYGYSTSLLLNRNLIVDNEYKKIILFADKIVAYILSLNSNELPFIPSVINFFMEQPKIDLSDLKYREVIIVPLPQVESYFAALRLAKELESSKVKSTHICNYSIYPSCRIEITTSLALCELFIKHIVENSKSFMDVIWSNFLIDSDHLLTPNHYEEWLTKMGLISNKSINKHNYISSMSDLAFIPPHDYSRVDLHDVLAPRTITFCYGKSTSGKSIWSLTLALSFACGFDIFEFSSSLKKKVLYIDYETRPNIFMSNINQLVHAYNLNVADVEANFKFSLKQKDKELTYIWNGEDNSAFISELKNLIKEYGINLIIIDTLVKAAPKSLNSLSNSVAFLEFIEKINSELGTSFLIIHHENKEGEMDGSSEFFKNATNVIQISKYTSIENHKGVALKVSYPKVKMAPLIENKESFYSLRLPDTGDKAYAWSCDPSLPTLSNGLSSSQINKIIPWDPNIYTYEENDILFSLFSFDKMMSLKEIMQYSKYKKTDTSLRSLIKNINSKSLNLQIICEGKARQSKYRLEISPDDGNQPTVR